MKIRMLILIGITLLSLSGGAVAAPDGPPNRPSWYVVKPGTASGGPYQLSGTVWQVRGETSGAGYHLVSPINPVSSENGCCCIYLPCIQRSSP